MPDTQEIWRKENEVLGTASFEFQSLQFGNHDLHEHLMDFTPDDIDYLIISDESEREEFIQNILTAKSRFNKNIKLKLVSKILSVEKIHNDI